MQIYRYYTEKTSQSKVALPTGHRISLWYNKEKEIMKKILNPQSIAIVGASNTTGKIGNILAQNIIDYDFTGKSYFINTKDDKILGKKSYTSLSKAAANAGGEIDVAIIAIPAQFVEKVIREGSDVCKNYVIISAGFGESDSAGHNREIALAQIAKEKPQCIFCSRDADDWFYSLHFPIRSSSSSTHRSIIRMWHRIFKCNQHREQNGRRRRKAH